MEHLLLEPYFRLLPESSTYHNLITLQISHLEVILDSSHILTTRMQTISKYYLLALLSKYIQNLTSSHYFSPKHYHLLPGPL